MWWLLFCVGPAHPALSPTVHVAALGAHGPRVNVPGLRGEVLRSRLHEHIVRRPGVVVPHSNRRLLEVQEVLQLVYALDCKEGKHNNRVCLQQE